MRVRRTRVPMHAATLSARCWGIDLAFVGLIGSILSTRVAAQGAINTQIVFVGVAFPAGETIGAQKEGIAKVVRNHYVLGATTAESWTTQTRDMATSIFQSRSLPVEIPSAVFGTVQTSSARYAMGGRVTAIEFNTYGNLAGNRSNANLTVEWDVLDRTTKQVVLHGETVGIDQEQGVTTDAVISAATQALGYWLDSDAFKSWRGRLAQQSGVSTPGMAGATTQSTTFESPAPHYAEYGAHDSTEVLRMPQLSVSSHVAIGDVMTGVFVIKVPDGFGSGFIIARSGLALTNYHVVRGVSEFDAVLSDRRTVRGRVLRVSDRDDVALVQVDCGTICPAIALASVADAKPGVDVFAIGTPLYTDLQQTLTKGVVSGMRRLDGVVYVQTDAAINRGNSGGPLVVAETGRALAINTWKLTGPNVESINFAVVIDDALTNLGISR